MLTTDIPRFLTSLIWYTVEHIAQATPQLTVYRFLYSPFGPLCLHSAPVGVLIQDLLWFIFLTTSGWHDSSLLQTHLVTWKTVLEGGEISQHGSFLFWFIHLKEDKNHIMALCLYLYWQIVRLAHYGLVLLPPFIQVWITEEALSREAQIILFPLLSSWCYGITHRCSRAWWEMQSHQRVLGLPRCSFPEGHAWNNPPGSRPAPHYMEE